MLQVSEFFKHAGIVTPLRGHPDIKFQEDFFAKELFHFLSCCGACPLKHRAFMAYDDSLLAFPGNINYRRNPVNARLFAVTLNLNFNRIGNLLLLCLKYLSPDDLCDKETLITVSQLIFREIWRPFREAADYFFQQEVSVEPVGG